MHHKRKKDFLQNSKNNKKRLYNKCWGIGRCIGLRKEVDVCFAHLFLLQAYARNLEFLRCPFHKKSLIKSMFEQTMS